MSGTWFDPTDTNTPRGDQAPSPGDDIFVGGEDADFFINDEGNPVPVIPGGDGNDTMDGRGGNDVLAGNEGDDSLLGGEGNDELYGGAGDDTLDGGDGDDFLDAQPGDDYMFGGTGDDTVVLNGTTDNYTWQATSGGWIVTDNRAGGDGRDFIAADIEWVQYNNAGSGDPTYAAPPCFAAGTRIMTARGEVPVEALRAGDQVVTLGLRGPWLRPVAWIGHRHVDCRRHPRPEAVLPIRIRAGSLGPGVPHRDLLVSPDHALFLDGVLVPAAALVDGVSVLRDVATRQVRYFHVELDAHDVLLAQGAPAESWLDSGNRSHFENGGLLVRLHPDFAAPRPAPGCAERVTDGSRVEKIRAAIAARSVALGATRPGIPADGTTHALP